MYNKSLTTLINENNINTLELTKPFPYVKQSLTNVKQLLDNVILLLDNVKHRQS